MMTAAVGVLKCPTGAICVLCVCGGASACTARAVHMLALHAVLSIFYMLAVHMRAVHLVYWTSSALQQRRVAQFMQLQHYASRLQVDGISLSQVAPSRGCIQPCTYMCLDSFKLLRWQGAVHGAWPAGNVQTVTAIKRCDKSRQLVFSCSSGLPCNLVGPF
jgi:hypothetical protein